MRPSGIGGQAVMEGVMMKNKNQYAVAVRKLDQDIVVEKKEYISASEKYKILKLPIIRGMAAFVESMVVGMKTLSLSASFFEEVEEAVPSRMEKAMEKAFKEKAESVVMGFTVLLSIVMAISIFMILPYIITNLLRDKIESNTLRAIIEGAIRLVIFICYIFAISQIKDIKRVFMYHGAEHKTINCLENGDRLTISNVRKHSKQHKRCGTSFLLYVMIISIIFFACIRVDNPWLRIIARILLVPVISGVAYEFIRLAGKSESKLVGILSKPGLWLQGLTTREPDDDMIEVAIRSVEAVFDWKDFLNGGDGSLQKQTKETNEKEKNTINSDLEQIVDILDNELEEDDSKKEEKENKNSQQEKEEIQKKDTVEDRKSSLSKNTNNKNKKKKNPQRNYKNEHKEVIQEVENDPSNKVVSINDFKRKAEEEEVIEPKKHDYTEPIMTRRETVEEEFEDEEDDEILKALDRYFDSGDDK